MTEAPLALNVTFIDEDREVTDELSPSYQGEGDVIAIVVGFNDPAYVLRAVNIKAGHTDTEPDADQIILGHWIPP